MTAGVGDGVRVSPELRARYEAVIGIECHVELKTASKMFCSCPNEFGGEPNTHVCPVCLALPGALPVANRVAIEHMLRAGLAFGAELPRFSKFDRKNYFYPDMPKNYQISQYDMPLTRGGVVRFWREDGSLGECRLIRIHLEEDTGKSLHAGSGDGRIAGSTSSLLDFNRAGVPLMECVSAPDLHTPEDAVAYLESLRRTLLRLGISDVKMEEGSLRCDANVSIRPRGATELGTKTEIKNMNSFRSVQRAIAYEIDRQILVIESGGRVVQETRGWDEVRGVTHPMRSKEEAHDYRYFPDPDLVPVEIDDATVERLRETIPELPWQRFERYTARYGIAPKQATQLIDNLPLADYFDAVVAASGNPQQSVNLVLGDLSRLANETGIAVPEAGIPPHDVAELIALIEGGTITSKVVKQLLARLWSGERNPRAIVEREGLAQTNDAAAIAVFVDEVLRQHAAVADDYRSGKKNAFGFLVGQVMKASHGKANPKTVEELLRSRLE